MILITKLYFVKSFIVAVTVLTWIPQILYNYFHRVHVSFPIAFIVSLSFNKVAMPLYFRVYESNILRFSPIPGMLSLLFFILLMQIAVLYCQIVFGSRFFCPNLIAGKNLNLYKSLEDVLKLGEELNKNDCIICINPLIPTEEKRDTEIGQSEDESAEKSVVPLQKTSIIRLIKKKMKLKLFEFHQSRIGRNNPFIITTCNHVFHSKCLNEWLKHKQECPTCRSELKL